MNPYLIQGPAIINFSGGRTSGYMLKHIIDAHGGTLPADVLPVFCNTGKERPETLDFVQECSERWATRIIWLEYRRKDGKPHFEEVNHNSASRNGEPFEIILTAYSPHLPNQSQRWCSGELKTKLVKRWGRKHLKWEEWTSVLGLRADEPIRVSRARHRAIADNMPWEVAAPLHSAGVVKADIAAFWTASDFDLRLKMVRGNTPAGNCDLCFMKSYPTLAGLIRDNPASADWWIAQEKKAPAKEGVVRKGYDRFRSDRPSYTEMKKIALTQGDMFAGDDESALDCACTD